MTQTMAFQRGRASVIRGLFTLMCAMSVAAIQISAQTKDGRRVAGIVEGQPVYADDLVDREIQQTRDKLFELESAKLREVTLRKLRESRPQEFKLGAVDVSDAEVRKLYDEAKLSQRGTIEEMTPQVREFLAAKKRSDVDERHFELALAKGYVKPMLIPPAAFEIELPDVVRAASKGPLEAPVYIVEFSDFQCPFCKRALPSVEQVMERYAGKVRLTYRHLPLVRIHPRAQELAEASECAAEQGKFWPFHDLVFELFENIDSIEPNAIAKQAGVRDAKKFVACRESRQYQKRVEEDSRTAESLGIGGTPTFLVGRRTADGKVKGVLLEGAQPFAQFEKAIERTLAKSGK